MINCLFFALCFSLFITFSFGGMTYSTIHRSFLNMQKSILEVSVVTIGDDGNDTDPYFNEPVLEKYVVDYLKENVEKYSPNYKASIVYFDADTKQINTNHHADGVRLSLSANINFFYSYQHAREFTIDGGGNLNE